MFWCFSAMTFFNPTFSFILVQEIHLVPEPIIGMFSVVPRGLNLSYCSVRFGSLSVTLGQTPHPSRAGVRSTSVSSTLGGRDSLKTWQSWNTLRDLLISFKNLPSVPWAILIPAYPVRRGRWYKSVSKPTTWVLSWSAVCDSEMC